MSDKINMSVDIAGQEPDNSCIRNIWLRYGVQ